MIRLSTESMRFTKSRALDSTILGMFTKDRSKSRIYQQDMGGTSNSKYNSENKKSQLKVNQGKRVFISQIFSPKSNKSINNHYSSPLLTDSNRNKDDSSAQIIYEEDENVALTPANVSIQMETAEKLEEAILLAPHIV